MLAQTPSHPETALYTVALDGASPISDDTATALYRQRVGNSVGEFAWAPSGAAIYFELSVKFVSNLWRLDMDAGTLKAGSLVQLTAGAGQDTRMAVSRDGKKVAFTTKAEAIRIWSYRLDAVTGRDHRLCGAGDRPHDGRARVRSARARRPPTRLCHHGRRDGKVGVVDQRSGDRTDARWCPVTIMIGSTRSGRRTAAAWRITGDARVRAARIWAARRSVAVRQVPGGDETLLSTPQTTERAAARLVSGRKLHPRELVATRAEHRPDALAGRCCAARGHTRHAGRRGPQARVCGRLASRRTGGGSVSSRSLAATAVVCVVPSSARNARASRLDLPD